MADNSIEKDALPEDPRHLSVQNEPQAVDRPSDVQEIEVLERAIQQDFQAPTEDWAFKRMLLNVSEELTDNDLDKFKFHFSGELGKGVQEKIKKPLQLFRIMEERHWLTRDNLLKLQAALRGIGRMDLVGVTAEYAQMMDNVLYFYQSSETVNGYRSVKFHLCNCNYMNTDRNHIQMIRLRFSELVGCAPEKCVIVGLEPATSLILTFHVPESFVCMFKELLKMSTCKARLRDIGIDMVEIEGEDELYHCSDEDVRSKSMIEEQKKLCNVYQLLENKTKLLESAEVKLLEQENEKFQCEALLKSLKPEFVKSEDNVSSEKVELLKKFEALSQRPELASYDKSLILSLLDINSKMISTVVAESQESLIKQMELEREHMKMQILDLRNDEVLGQFDLLKRRTFTDHEELSIDRYVPTSLIPCKRGQPNKKSGYDSIPHAESDSNEVKRIGLPKVRGMYQHLEFDPKRIADKTERESKRENTFLYKRKKDADPDTKTEQQSQEILERKQILLEIHDTFVPSPEIDVVKGFVYEQQV